jgi:hypothetical protein
MPIDRRNYPTASSEKPASVIPLGFGHPPDDLQRKTVLDVHLHLDFPDGPFSIGEHWGSAPGVGTQTTLHEIVKRFLAHVQACGCEWLVPLAPEETLRGKIFTPHEILARKPVPTPRVETQEPPKSVRRGKPATEVMPRIRDAIGAGDFEKLEGLRDEVTDEIAGEVINEWHAGLPWDIKDAYASLLQDQLAASVHPLFRDALNSPTVETRAYALCVLTGDFTQFTSMMTRGSVDAAKVDAAIAKAGLR